MHHLHLRPVRALDPAIDLAAAVRTDRHDEGRAAHLFGEPERARLVEFLRSVDGEAVGRAAQRAREHGHFRGVGAEMSVHVRRAGCAQPHEHAAGFGEVGKVVG